jgi:CheY-like chemotaxis protein
MEARRYDLLVLDINLPLRRETQPVRDGGLRLLKQLQLGGPRLKYPEHIIGLTEYPELYDEFVRDFTTVRLTPRRIVITCVSTIG